MRSVSAGGATSKSVAIPGCQVQRLGTTNGTIRFEKAAALRPLRKFLGQGVCTLVTIAVLLWAFWPTFAYMVEQWRTNPQYSHGFLVPILAGLILWSRRYLYPENWSPPHWLGLVLVALAGLLRLGSAYFYVVPLDGLAFLASAAGMVLVLGGAALWRWAWPGVLFLGFMLPLPFQVEVALSQPLRRLATVSSTFLLQTFGFPALAEGNVILLGELRLGVIDACSGLGMLFTFFALATAFAVICPRPPLDRWILALSAVPIALITNIIRITVTAMAHVWFGVEVGHVLMHDLAGWIMMPMAIALLFAELWLLSRLFVLVDPEPIAPPLFNETPGESHKNRKPAKPLANGNEIRRESY